MIRICPKRDAVCPYGMACPFTKDRYNCLSEKVSEARHWLAGQLLDPRLADEEAASVVKYYPLITPTVGTETREILEAVRDHLWNPFEPDNQSAIYKRLDAFIKARIK